MIKINRNILKLRKQIGYTQEDLAHYLNLTKATISKWENDLSYPDIKYLPVLANLFDISVDELIGYSPYLEKNEIKKLHASLTSRINKDNFDAILSEIEQLFKSYTNDYSTILMLSKVLINHAFLSQKRDDIIRLAIQYTDRVIYNCQNPNMINHAIFLKANCYTILEDYENVVSLIHDRPYKLGEELILAHSYLRLGRIKEAKIVVQAEIYQQLIILITHLNMLIQFNLTDQVEETIKRAEAIVQSFNINTLHPNTALNFNLLSAMYYASKDTNRSINYLKQYVANCRSLIQEYYLHGDDYFDVIDEWLDDTPTGIVAPIDKENIKNTMLQTLYQLPHFNELRENQDFKNIEFQLQQLIKEEK